MHYFTQGLLLEIMSAMTCQIMGIDPIDPKQQCLDANPVTGKLGFTGKGGAIGAVTTSISGLYVVPIRVGDYVAYLSNNFGIAKQSYAQQGGTGFYSLAPMLKLWTALRNISYLLFIIIFLLIGFAVMLRINIDARTVMTIQNQIPKLIIGILLVTFSYAIAGLLVDTMWVANYVVVENFAPYTGFAPNDVLNQTTQIAPNFVNYMFGDANSLINFGGIIGVTTGAANGIGDFVQNMFTPKPTPDNSDPFTTSPPATGGTDCGWNIFCAIGNWAADTIGNIVANIVGGIVSWVVRILGYLIIGIAILFALIMLWIALIKAYVFVLIDIILAPFWIVAGLLPGAGAGVGFGAWVKDLLGNLMAFPATIALFLLGKVILYSFSTTTVAGPAGTSPFSPPLIGSTVTTGGLGSLLALGIILMSPNIVNATKKAFKSTGGLSFGGGDFLKTGGSIVGGFIGGGARNYFRRDQYGRAIGGGAIALDSSKNRFVKGVAQHRLVRGFMGWNNELNAEKTPELARQYNARMAQKPEPIVQHITNITPPASGGPSAPPAAPKGGPIGFRPPTPPAKPKP